MSELLKRQELCMALIDSCRIQRQLLESVDGGAPSNEWAILAAMQLSALMISMKNEYRQAASVIVREFCESAGIDFEQMETYVFKKVTP